MSRGVQRLTRWRALALVSRGTASRTSRSRTTAAVEIGARCCASEISESAAGRSSASASAIRPSSVKWLPSRDSARTLLLLTSSTRAGTLLFESSAWLRRTVRRPGTRATRVITSVFLALLSRACPRSRRPQPPRASSTDQADLERIAQMPTAGCAGRTAQAAALQTAARSARWSHQAA
eukprot:3001043-Prymnesium_polylepis.1